VTGDRLVRDLSRLGVRPGQTLLAHASVRSTGLPDGGAMILVGALLQAIGPAGNVVVPTATEENSLTSRAHQAWIERRTADEVEAFPRTCPPFDRDATPSTTGALGEAVRTANGAVRSAHPQSSFAALGPLAAYLMADHPLECHLGEQSPLAKLYQLDAQVLLLGVGYRACTAFHLAEYRYTAHPPRQTYSCAVLRNGHREWLEYEDVVLDDQEFEKIGLSLDKDEAVQRRDVGNAESRLIPVIKVVDHAVEWMAKNRRLPAYLRGPELPKTETVTYSDFSYPMSRICRLAGKGAGCPERRGPAVSRTPRIS
jgi:aminoglycoside 3-N-acetyltransferase